MDSDRNPVFGGGLRQSDDAAIEESGLLGTHRRCSNINRYEIIFLITAILGAMATDGLTIYRLTEIKDISNPDWAYAVLILVNSLFLLVFLITGIAQQRITDIVAFFISAIMLTVYVITHYIYRLHNKQKGEKPEEETLRLVRLIITVVVNVLFFPLSIIVIRDYQRDEFAKRLFGTFPAARWPIRMYNIFDCVARINTMLSISTFILNLYNFNDYKTYDVILLSIGIPLSLIWLGVAVGMVRLESRILVGIFCLVSLFQPGFLGFCLYSAIDDPPEPTTSTSTSAPTPTTSTLSSTSTTPEPPHLSVPIALFVCIGVNIVTHLLSCFCAFLCIRNFGKGLKERVFNNQADKWLQRRWTNT